MKLSTAGHFLSKGIILSAFTVIGLSLGSCDSWIYDEQGDCSVHYSVAFSYTQNMLSADAFSSQVKSVTLYLVDKEGRIIMSKSDSSEALATPGYTMEVDVQSGQYDLYVWAAGESPVSDNTAFLIGGGETSNITDLSADLPLKGVTGEMYCDQDIPPLYYGYLGNVDFPDTYGDITVCTVDLMKDTHRLQVLLQTTDGSAIEPTEFTFKVDANNSQLNYKNEVSTTPWFEYRPWSVAMTSASFDTPEVSAGEVNGLLTEFSMGRFVADRSPRFIIHRSSDDTDIFSINLIEYLLMVKGEYNRLLTDQQYLDRMDSHTMMIFLDENHDWYAGAGVYINGWRIVPREDVTL